MWLQRLLYCYTHCSVVAIDRYNQLCLLLQQIQQLQPFYGCRKTTSAVTLVLIYVSKALMSYSSVGIALIFKSHHWANIQFCYLPGVQMSVRLYADWRQRHEIMKKIPRLLCMCRQIKLCRPFISRDQWLAPKVNLYLMKTATCQKLSCMKSEDNCFR